MAQVVGVGTEYRRSFRHGHRTASTSQGKLLKALETEQIALAPKSSSQKTLYSAEQKKLVRRISGYLIQASDIYPEKRSTPLSNLPEMTLGNMAKDGGHLFLDRDAKESLLVNFPQAKKFVRRVLGSQE